MPFSYTYHYLNWFSKTTTTKLASVRPPRAAHRWRTLAMVLYAGTFSRNGLFAGILRRARVSARSKTFRSVGAELWASREEQVVRAPRVTT